MLQFDECTHKVCVLYQCFYLWMKKSPFFFDLELYGDLFYSDGYDGFKKDVSIS